MTITIPKCNQCKTALEVTYSIGFAKVKVCGETGKVLFTYPQAPMWCPKAKER